MISQDYAFITGASTRIGKEIAVSLARKKYNIIFSYHRSKEAAQKTKSEILKLGVDCKYFRANFETEEDITKLAQNVFLNHKCSLVIHNASHFEYDSCDNLNFEQINKTLKINLVGPLLLNSNYYKSCLKNKTKGLIIHILDAKLKSLNPDFYSYTISKSAVKTALTLEAMKFAKWIRVNGISPGLMLISGKQTEKSFSKALKTTALGQGLQVSSILQTLEFLISNNNITGQVITVDDGFALLKLPRDVSFLDKLKKDD